MDKRSASTRTGQRPRHGANRHGALANRLASPAWIANDARDLGPGGVVRWMRSAVSLRSRRAYPPYELGHQIGRWLKYVGWISAAHPPEPGIAQGLVQSILGCRRTRYHRGDELRMMPGCRSWVRGSVDALRRSAALTAGLSTLRTWPSNRAMAEICRAMKWTPPT